MHRQSGIITLFALLLTFDATAQPVYVNHCSGGPVKGVWRETIVLDSSTSVLSGDTLRILAGTCILVGGTNSSIRISGTLLAEGTPQRPIQFLSGKSKTAAWDWDRIYFEVGSESYLSSCMISNCNYGIFCNGGQVTLLNCVLDSNSITGIYASTGTVSAVLTTVRGRTSIGVFADAGGYVELDNCAIFGNYIGVGCAADGGVYIEDSRILANVRGIVSARDGDVTLYNSQIWANTIGVVSEPGKYAESYPGIKGNKTDIAIADSSVLAEYLTKPTGARELEEQKDTASLPRVKEPRATFAAIATTARRMTSIRPSVTLGALFQRWTKKTDTTAIIQELTFPVNLSIPVSERFKIFAGMAYAHAALPIENDVLSGANDLRIQAAYVMAKDRLLLMGGLNFPTGKRRLAGEEAEVAAFINDEDLLFGQRAFGEGFGGSASLAWSDSLGKLVKYGIGAGYLYRGPYTRLKTDIYQIDPGDIGVFTGGLDLKSGINLVRADVSVSLFTPDRSVTKEQFKQGFIFASGLGYNLTTKAIAGHLAVHNLYRGPNSYNATGTITAEDSASNGNLTGLDLDVKYNFTQRFNASLMAGLDVQTPNQYSPQSSLYKDRKLLLGGGGGVGFVIAKGLSADLKGGYYAGSIGPKYALRGGIELDGVEAELSMNYEF